MICQVTIWVDDRGTDKQVWFAFQTEHENLHDLFDDLTETGMVVGWRLNTVSVGNGSRKVTGRYEFIVAKDAVVTISPPQFTIVEAAVA